MGLHVYQGTWDEIKRFEKEFAGHQLQVIIVPDRINQNTGQDDKEARKNALKKFLTNTVLNVIVDDSREAIYGFEKDR